MIGQVQTACLIKEKTIPEATMLSLRQYFGGEELAKLDVELVS